MKSLLKKRHLLILAIVYSSLTFGDSFSQATKLYQALTGTNPTEAEKKILAKKITEKKYEEAARDIVESRNGIDSKSSFYNVTVKNFATPWTNRDETKMFPLNDLSATVIGWVRDEKKFNEILWKDSLYMGNGISMAGTVVSNGTNSELFAMIYSELKTCSGLSEVQSCSNCKDPDAVNGRVIFIDPKNPNGSERICRLTKMTRSEFITGVSNDHFYIPHLDVKITVSPKIIKHTNVHYEEIEALGLPLADTDLLVENSQTKIHQDPKAIGGIMTTRAWGMAYMSAGTNRRNIAGAMKHFFCKEMIDLNDTQIPDFRVRQDVDRAPGGDSKIFKSLCVGCHAGMDGLAGAFAYYDFPAGAVIYDQGKVVKKMVHNKVFTEGFVTQNDTWTNLWTEGINSKMGWGPISGGEGVKSLGKMFSQTKEFPKCMAKQVFKTVCFKEKISSSDQLVIDELSTYLENNDFNMKKLFMKTAIVCMGS